MVIWGNYRWMKTEAEVLSDLDRRFIRLAIEKAELAREAGSRFLEEEGTTDRPCFVVAGMGPYGVLVIPRRS